MLDFLAIFSSEIFDVHKNSLAIITNAGGLGILAVDAVADFKLNLPRLNLSQQRALKSKLPSFASLENPFDLGGDADALSYQKTISYLEDTNLFAAILVIVTPQSMTEIDQIAKIITEFRRRRPILTAFLGGPKIKNAKTLLSKARIPNYDDPREAIMLLGKIYRYYQKASSDHEIINLSLEKTYSNQSEEQLIDNYNLPFAKFVKVTNDAELMGHIEEIGYPVVYKAANVKARGKRGKVGLSITDHSALQRAVRAIGYPGILQKMIDSTVEIIIGARRDPKFGITLLFGEGGIFVEEENDINFRILPLTDQDLDEMIEQTKVWQIIKRMKIKAPVKEVILKIAKLMRENPDIKEIELNPLKVLPKKIIAVDINIKKES